MNRSFIALVLALLLVAVFAASPMRPAEAGAGTAVAGAAGGLQHQTLVQPVIVWRDCQRIARCNGCRPVYHCRSCTYQRTCRNNYGYCGWADVCVWGPYLPVAPRGVPIR
jgi:hypothetical protein